MVDWGEKKSTGAKDLDDGGSPAVRRHAHRERNRGWRRRVSSARLSLSLTRNAQEGKGLGFAKGS